MEDSKESKVERLIIRYNESINDIAVEILEELKKENTTYGELNKDISKLAKSLEYKDAYQYEALIAIIKSKVLIEMNDLPLTNRSK